MECVVSVSQSCQDLVTWEQSLQNTMVQFNPAVVALFLSLSIASLLVSRFVRWRAHNYDYKYTNRDWTRYQLQPVYEMLLHSKNLCIVLALVVVFMINKGIGLTCVGDRVVAYEPWVGLLDLGFTILQTVCVI